MDTRAETAFEPANAMRALLCAVPLLLDVRTAGDEGHPVVLSAPGSPAAVAFRDIAARVAKMLA